MMTKFIKYLTSALLMSVSAVCHAQNANMADGFRSEGKIYVVVAIILIVLSGLLIYLYLLDRKLNRLERSINSKKQTN